MDSSTSVSDEDYTNFISSLASRIESAWPSSGGKFGLLIFATDAEIRIPLVASDASTLASLIRSQPRMAGATNVEIAMFIGLEDMWMKNNIDQSRPQVTFIITDGVPSNGQNPCGELPFYLQNGIAINVIAIG